MVALKAILVIPSLQQNTLLSPSLTCSTAIKIVTAFPLIKGMKPCGCPLEILQRSSKPSVFRARTIPADKATAREVLKTLMIN